VNRNLGPFAQHALGVLSRVPLSDVQHHALPGQVPGRGALEVTLQTPAHHPLQLVIAHLALGRGTRSRQIEYLARLAREQHDTLLLGDLNCEPEELAQHPGLQKLGFRIIHDSPTYPSWRPRRSIDQVLAGPGVITQTCLVLPDRLSDHLAVATEVQLRPR
jgi:endonuclease/exonuclease/phosphatase family metal-dependent hydrolase